MDGSGALMVSSNYRILETDTSYISDNGAWWLRTIEKVYAQNGGANATVTGTRKQRLTGLGSNGMIQEEISSDMHGI
ncbi:hypothetical protein JXQ70_03270 [bacterium]|nr:hypothetical protein [bacterium]